MNALISKSSAIIFACLGVAAGLVAAACSSSSTDTPPGQCTAGQSTACTCANGQSGTYTCGSDPACSCESGGQDAGTDAAAHVGDGGHENRRRDADDALRRLRARRRLRLAVPRLDDGRRPHGLHRPELPRLLRRRPGLVGARSSAKPAPTAPRTPRARAASRRPATPAATVSSGRAGPAPRSSRAHASAQHKRGDARLLRKARVADPNLGRDQPVLAIAAMGRAPLSSSATSSARIVVTPFTRQ